MPLLHHIFGDCFYWRFVVCVANWLSVERLGSCRSSAVGNFSILAQPPIGDGSMESKTPGYTEVGISAIADPDGKHSDGLCVRDLCPCDHRSACVAGACSFPLGRRFSAGHRFHFRKRFCFVSFGPVAPFPPALRPNYGHVHGDVACCRSFHSNNRRDDMGLRGLFSRNVDRHAPRGFADGH